MRKADMTEASGMKRIALCLTRGRGERKAESGCTCESGGGAASLSFDESQGGSKMLKNFMELYKLDVSAHVKERIVTGKVTTDYIPWMDVVVLLHENGAESVKYGNLYAEDGHSLFMKDGRCPEVHVYVEIDGERREATYPLIKGSFALKPENIDQLAVSNATQRAFVKCVATNWGLGLKVWQKEEFEVEKNAAKDLSEHSLFAIKERIQQVYTNAFKKGMSTKEIADAMDMTEDEVKTVFTYFDQLDRFEKKLKAL